MISLPEPDTSAAAPAGPRAVGYPLVERSAAVTAVTDLLTGLATGRPVPSLAVCGLPGMGRSALICETCHQAGQQGVRVLAAAASTADGPNGQPFAVADRLLTGWPPGMGPGRRVPAPAPGLTAIEHRADHLLQATAGRPTVLAVDDLQCIDAPSLHVLECVLRRAAQRPLALVVSILGTEDNLPRHCTRFVESLQGGAVPGTVLALGPLSAPAVRALTQQALAHHGEQARPGDPARSEPPEDDDAALARWARLARVSRGNPALVLSALRLWQADGSPNHPATGLGRRIPIARRHLVASLLAKLPPRVLQMLQIMAAARGLLPLPTLAALAGLPEPVARRAIATLRRCDLVEQSDLNAAPGADLTLARLEPQARQALLVDVATAAFQHGADDPDLAAMLLTAQPSGRDWAAGVLRRAAAAAASGGRAVRAAELLDRALAEPTPPGQRAGTELALIGLQVRRRPAAADRRAAGLLRPGVPAPVQAQAVDLLLARGDAPGAVQAVRDALGDACAPSADQVTTSPDLASLYWLAVSGVQPLIGQARATEPAAGPGSGDEPPAGRGWDVLATSAHPAVRSVFAWLITAAGRDHARARTLALSAVRPAIPQLGTLAGRPVVPDRPVLPQLAACRVLTLTGEFTAALAAADQLTAQTRRLAIPALLARTLLTRAELWLRGGHHQQANCDLTAAESVLPESSWHPVALPSLRALQVLLAVQAQRWAAAEEAAFGRLPPASEPGTAWNELLYARAVLLLRTGRPAAALSEALECGRRLSAANWWNPALVPWRPVAAAAWLRLGEQTRAHALRAEHERLWRLWAGPA